MPDDATTVLSSGYGTSGYGYGSDYSGGYGDGSGYGGGSGTGTGGLGGE